MDMSMMVEQQGETLTTIENHAEQTEGHIKEGNTFISKAIQSAKSTRTVRLFLTHLLFHFLILFTRKNGAAFFFVLVFVS